LTGIAAEWVASGSARIQRGASWLTPAADAASYARRGEVPAAIGAFSFRCARSLEP